MNLIIVSASQRPDSASRRCGEYLQQLADGAGFQRSELIDLGTEPLPLWDTEFADKTGHWQRWTGIQEKLQQADAFILITPEWHGMSTPALKNFLLLATQQELGHKPALLAAVSAADNGAYPISEIRMTGTKNNHLCLLPDHLIFRKVDQLITCEPQCTDEYFEQRCHYTLALLQRYAKALTLVREDGSIPSAAFAYGM